MNDRISDANFTHNVYKGYEYIIYYWEHGVMCHMNAYVKIPEGHPAIQKINKRRWGDLGLSMWRFKKSEAKRNKTKFNDPKPKSNRYYNWRYDDVDLRVHGGLSFGEKITKKDMEYWIQPFTEGWWVGWDYSHAGDEMYLPKERIIEKDEQTQNLYAEIMAIHNKFPGLPKDVVWTWEEVEKEALDAIEQLIELEKGYPKCEACGNDFWEGEGEKLCFSCRMDKANIGRTLFSKRDLNTSTKQAKATFNLRAGAAVRGQIKGAIEGFCLQNDINLQIKESKGIFQSTYYFKATGTNAAIEALESEIKSMEK